MAAHHWPARLGELSRCSRRDLGQTTLTKGFVGMQRIFSNGRQQSLLLSGCGCMQSVASASSHRLHATRRLKQEFFLGRSNIPFGARLFFWWLLALWREDWLFFFGVARRFSFDLCRRRKWHLPRPVGTLSVDCKQSGRNRAAQRRPLNEK